MDIQALREHIVVNELVPTILESLGCKAIKFHGTYYSCTNYTRDLDSVSRHHDLFTLVQFYQDCSFFDAVKYICNCLGLSIYHDFDEELPESLVITRELLKLINEGDISEPDKPLKPIPEDNLRFADINKDNRVNINDLVKLRKYLAGLEEL